jgi:hypothetical protein
MAVVVVNEIQGGDQDLYDRVNPKVMPDGLPDGCQAHIAGPVEGGWRVITVWESEERFQQFRECARPVPKSASRRASARTRFTG